MIRAAAGLLMFCLVAPASAQQARDQPRWARTGNASITGLVVSDEVQAKPLRRVRVTLTGLLLVDGARKTTITGDDGTFAFSGLPSGRYTVAAVKDAYVPSSYGATRPARPGAAITLAEGETRRITIRLPRGSVITGVIRDADGLPAPGIGVYALQYRYVASLGERRLVPAPAGSTASATDDTGTYRIFGLPAGEYVIATQTRQEGPLLQRVSPSDVRRALADVRAPASIASTRLPSTLTPAPFDSSPAFTLAPVYYPGTAAAAHATPVSLATGEERAGIDFQLQYVPVATVSGSLSLSAPRPRVTLTRRDAMMAAQGSRWTTPDSSGRFTFTGIVPGEYTITTMARPPTVPGASAEPAQWASTDITVDGQDVSVALTLQPVITIGGRIVFEGTRPKPMLPGGRLRLPLFPTAGGPAAPLELQPDADSRFTIADVVPGRYRLASGQGLRTPIGSWWLKSAVLNGRDLLDAPIDVQQGFADAVVTFSDRASELTGTVTDGAGEPRTDHVVIVFSADKAAWFYNSRRVAGVRLDSEGRYTIRNLPPGEYMMAASDDLGPNEWFDPWVLERLTPAATRISLGEFDAIQKDLVVR